MTIRKVRLGCGWPPPLGGGREGDDKNVQVSDTRNDDSSNVAGYPKKTICYFFLFLSIFSLTAVSLSAQKILTLEEAIANTLQKNYDIILSKNDSTLAAIDYSYRNAAFIPRLNANAGTVWNNNAQKQTLSDGTKRDRTGLKSNNITSQLALNWTLFDGLKMFITRDRLEQLVEFGELEIRNQVVNTVAAVINNYYNIVRQKQQLKAIEEQMSIDSERVRLAQYRLDVGVGIKPDLLQSKIDLNAQKAAQLQQQALIEQLKEQLNQAMALPQFTVYDVVDTIMINTSISLGEVMSAAEKNNPAVLMAKKNIDIANLVLKERKAELFPTISFNSAYNFNRTTNQAVINTFSTLFNQVHGYNYGFTATIPILNNFNARRQIRQAKWSIDYQNIVYENQRSVTTLNVINAFQNYEQQKKALDLEEENILLARENLDIVFQTYKLGAATLLQLKEAQNSLADAYNRLIAARYNAKVSETELLRLSGQIVQ
ncbi:MAG TPA: TolC family protein [Chitinophagaceae bacterium]|jgi:outer membrane protein TolC|nr:TolC family protein [Chitinophagaceae bacterium]